MESDTRSHTLSGCPSVTDSDVNKYDMVYLFPYHRCHYKEARARVFPRHGNPLSLYDGSNTDNKSVEIATGYALAMTNHIKKLRTVFRTEPDTHLSDKPQDLAPYKRRLPDFTGPVPQSLLISDVNLLIILYLTGSVNIPFRRSPQESSRSRGCA